jgi:arginase
MDSPQPRPVTNVQVALIGAALGLGGPDHGAAEAPARLRDLGLATRLEGPGIHVDWTKTVQPRFDSVDRLALVDDFNQRLGRRVAGVLRAGHFPIVIGGDHAIAAGTWAAVARVRRAHGPLGLLWIDAHMDAHTPATTPSGNPHGMPLATLLGADGIAPALLPAHVALVGVRSFEHAEDALLTRLGVRVFPQSEVDARGLAACIDEALAIVTRAPGGFGATLDVDALDPFEAPATSTRALGGLRAGDVLDALDEIAAHPRLVGFELVEYNPRLDADGTTAKLVAALLGRVVAARRRVGVDGGLQGG